MLWYLYLASSSPLFENETAKMPSKRNLRVGNVSGATGDAPHAMLRMARDGNVDIITGDWLSEMNIAWNSIAKAQDPSVGFEAGFLDQLEESIDTIVAAKIKVVTNAGALNTVALHGVVEDMCRSKGHANVVVATVLGDDVTDVVVHGSKGQFQHLDHADWTLSEWNESHAPTNAAAYLGAWGIVEALRQGADIVLCGRVTDASPVVSRLNESCN